MIKFKEDKTSLRNRINIHSQYGQKDMVEWVSKLVKQKKILTFWTLHVVTVFKQLNFQNI